MTIHITSQVRSGQISSIYLEEAVDGLLVIVGCEALLIAGAADCLPLELEFHRLNFVGHF